MNEVSGAGKKGIINRGMDAPLTNGVNKMIDAILIFLIFIILIGVLALMVWPILIILDHFKLLP